MDRWRDYLSLRSSNWDMINSGSPASCSQPSHHCSRAHGIRVTLAGRLCNRSGIHQSETQAADGLRDTAAPLLTAAAVKGRVVGGTWVSVLGT